MEDTQYHHENLRQTLIESGIKYINMHGYEELSLRKIAKECNVSHNAPYRHFKDKDDLLKSMQDYVEEQFSKVLKKNIKKSEKSYSMISFGKAYVEFFAENPEYYKFIFARDSIHISLEINDDLVPSNFTPYNIFYKEAKKHFAAHNLPKEEQLQELICMWSMVHGLAGLATMGSINYEGDWGILTEKILKGVQPHE